MPHEDVGRGGHRFDSRDAKCSAQRARQHTDHSLHRAEVIENCHKCREKDDDWQHAHREDESPRARRIGGVAKDEPCSVIGEGDDLGDQRRARGEDYDQRRPTQKQIRQRDLQHDPSGQRAIVDVATMLGECEADQ